MELLFYLLIFYILLSVLLYSSLAYNPLMWLHRMPPEVIAKVPAKTPGEKRLLLIAVAIPFLLLVGYPIVYVLRQDANWLNYFLILCAFFVGFDVWQPSWFSFEVISGKRRQNSIFSIRRFICLTKTKYSKSLHV
jgi:hypothetical protein